MSASTVHPVMAALGDGLMFLSQIPHLVYSRDPLSMAAEGYPGDISGWLSDGGPDGTCTTQTRYSFQSPDAPRESSGELVGTACTNAGMNIGTHPVAIGSALLYRLYVSCVLGPFSPLPSLASATMSTVTPTLVSALTPVVKAPKSLSHSPVASGL